MRSIACWICAAFSADSHAEPRMFRADHEELVQVGAEDREELDALEQRVALVERLFQHAQIELQLSSARG
jgi:hypothetical protein